jgi:hypothetical protein
MNRSAPSFTSAILPPFAAALGYAAAKSIGQGASWGGLYWQSPVTYSFFAGLLVAMGLRPVLARVPWQRSTAFALVLACFAAIGPLSDWWEAALLERLGALAFPYALSRDAMPDLLGAWAAAGLLAWFYRPHGGDIGWHSLRTRLLRRPPAQWLTRMALMGIAVSGVSLLSALAGGELARNVGVPPLDAVNPWLRLTPAGGEGIQNGVMLAAWAAAWTSSAAVLAVDWLRGIAFALPMLALALAIRASKAQFALAFGMVVFIVGRLAPLIEDQPFPSQIWLSLRVAFAALESAAIGLAGAFLIGPLSPRQAAPPPAGTASRWDSPAGPTSVHGQNRAGHE